MKAHRGRPGLVLVLACALTTVGCVSEEKINKSKGYYQEGIAFLQTDRQKAFVSFQKSLQQNPNHKESHYYLGHLYAVQGKYADAEEHLKEVLRLDPDYSDAENYLGQVYEQQERWPDAIRSYRRALNNPLYETPDRALYNLGRALAHEGEMEEASRAFEDALRISPPSVSPASVHLELGRAYYKLGFDTKARESLTRVSSLDKGGPFAAEANKLLERLRP